MGEKTGISWTDHTWNPWQGCRKVSPGCAHCYMYREKGRYGQDPAHVIRSSRATFSAPLRWKEPARVFVCSWSDFFIEDADPWRDEAWNIIRRTPHLTYQILTKRPENIDGRLPEIWPLPNVWLGVTAEDQQRFDERVKRLVNCAGVFAERLFISIEPMIGPIVLRSSFFHDSPWGPQHFWIIAGGETGPDARMMQPEWALSIKQQCEAWDIPFFMKQMTNRASIPEELQGQQFP